MIRFTQISEGYLDYRSNLLSKISSIEPGWLHKSDGLGLMTVINNVLDKYKEPITTEEINNFKRGVELLRKTSMSNDIDYKLNRFGRIEDAKLIKYNGEYSFLNKLNTNYSDQAEFLSELISRGIQNNPDKGEVVYHSIMDNPKAGLLKLKPHLLGLINKYFISLEDFENFTKNAHKNSAVGELAENQVVDKLKGLGFDIVYQGGNGDFIDMIFGCDIIVYRQDVGYKTVQVKNRLPNLNSVSYYKVDWIATGSPFIVYPLRSSVDTGSFSSPVKL